MDFEIGIVCGRCDRYAPMGVARCVCGNALALEDRASEAVELPLRIESALTPRPPAPPFVEAFAPHPAPSVRPGRPVIPEEARSTRPLDPPSFSSPPPPVEEPAPPTLVGKSAISDAPPATLLGREQLRPRRAPSTNALRSPSTAAETSVSSPKSEDPHAAPFDVLALAASMNLTLEELMDQAKNFVCRSCSTPVPVGHKFCGRCGAAIPPEIAGARTQFFGQLQAPGKAKLILIRGEGVEGLSYQLNAEQHVVGRNGQLVFPDDNFVSPKHANLFYRNGKLVVRDEGSLNGVFVRVRGTVDVALGDSILAGEQLFRLEGPAKANDGPAPDGTYFYSSPKHQTLFRVIQVLEGGMQGMCVCARTPALQIGREGGDLNFPGDLYMSASHCRIDENQGRYTLTDMNSRNGTYLRLKAERELGHGDYLFIGRKLLRVEITAA